MITQPLKAPTGTPDAASASPLLSIEDSRRLARPLRSRNHAERELVRDTLQKIYSDWFAQWALPSAQAGAPAQIRLIDTVTESVLSDERAQELTKLVLFGERVTRPDLTARPNDGWAMSEDLGSDAWSAWQAALAPLFEGAGRMGVSPGRVDPWSGALHIAFPWADDEWVLHLNALQVDRLLGRRRAQPVPNPPSSTKSPSLIPLSRAMHGHALTVRVELGSLSLNLGQLWSLSVGDVVTLDHALDTPAAMYLVSSGSDSSNSAQADAAPLCATWLGQASGQMAVELLPLS